MGLKSTAKSAIHGHGLLGIGIAVGIGVAIFVPLFTMLYQFIASKISGGPSASADTGV